MAQRSDLDHSPMEHRGRFQVHGKKSVLLDSQPWDQDKPYSAADAHRDLGGLHSRVRADYRKDCEILEEAKAFAKTYDLIDRVADNGGQGPYKWSWPQPPRKDQRRVDTEISNGLAFVRLGVRKDDG
jgi:hypothetical protein